MKVITVLALTLAVLGDAKVLAQATLKADAEKWTVYNGKVEFSGDTIHVTNMAGKTTLILANDVTFNNGIIELDIKGNGKKGASFLGVAFHALDDNTYDAIYFRPFTFRDPETKDHAVQYISLPGYDWDVLREKHPRKYETAMIPETDPNEWFHIKIVVQHPNIKVFVNKSTVPVIEVKQLSERKNGRLGLWVDSPDGRFRNVTITNGSTRK